MASETSEITSLHPDIEEVVFTEDQIKEIVAKMGRQITADYQGKCPLVVCVLKGASMFMSDLIRHIKLPMEIDFMVVSSYGNQTTSSGTIQILKDLESDISGRDIIIVEDILDTGITLSYLIDNFQTRKPASVQVAAFLVKDVTAPRTAAIEPAYEGAHVDDRFIVGYGLDYAERFRNLPYIGVLKPEVYTA